MDGGDADNPWTSKLVTEGVWAGNAATRMHRGIPLPAKYETARGITIVSGQPLSLADLGSSITAQTGIPVRVAEGGQPSRFTASATPTA